MKKVIIWGGIIALTVGSFIWIGSSTSGTGQQPDITFSQVQEEVSRGAKLYDVRTAAEYQAGHFDNAENWSLQAIQAGTLPDIPKDSKIFVYCQSGNRSGQAAALLKKSGYTNIVDLHGVSDVQEIGGTLLSHKG